MLNRSKKDKSLKEEINQWLSEKNLQKKFEQVTIGQFWEDVVGKLVASKTMRIHLSKGVLTVNLESSVLRNEIVLYKQHIINELNKKLQKLEIEEIKVY